MKIKFMSIIEIKILNVADANELSLLVNSEPKEYSKYFVPFSFELESIKKILSDAEKDKYFGIYIDKILCGFYMLRGFDEGYEIPSYGVWIAKKHSGMGLGKLTVQHAFSFCRLNSIKKIMLKVHPDNKVAKKIYEDFGFKNEGIDEKIGHLIYFKDLN